MEGGTASDEVVREDLSEMSAGLRLREERGATAYHPRGEKSQATKAARAKALRWEQACIFKA